MKSVARRGSIQRFTILDAMLLIIAIAAGLAYCRMHREALASRFSRISDPAEHDWSFLSMFNFVGDFCSLFMPSLHPLVLALLLIGIRQRPIRLRRLFRQPGIVGALIVTLAPFAVFILNMQHSLLFIQDFEVLSKLISNVDLIFVGVGIAASWITLALCGCFRPERNWVDRLGRIICSAWLAIAIFDGIFD